MAKCKICREPHKACGGPTSITPVDSRVVVTPAVTPNQGGIVTDLKRYNVRAQGRRGGVDTVQLLSAADAKAAGLTDKDLYEKPKAKAASAAASTGTASGGGRSRSRSSKAKAAATPANKAAAPAGAKDDAGAGSTGSAE